MGGEGEGQTRTQADGPPACPQSQVRQGASSVIARCAVVASPRMARRVSRSWHSLTCTSPAGRLRLPDDDSGQNSPACHRRRGNFCQRRSLRSQPPSAAPRWSEIIAVPMPRRIDRNLVKVIARTFRRRELLEIGKYATIAEIAEAERINE